MTRNVALILAARVAMSAGRALAGVVTPIYLALLGFTAFEIAEYVLVVALVSAVLSTGVGLSSDRMGRRPFLVAMPLLTAAAAVVFAFTDVRSVLFVMGALGSFGRGAGAGAGAVGPYQPAESALATESVSPDQRNTVFGRLAFGASAGAMLGGLLALLVSSRHVHGSAATELFRPAFLAISSLSVIAACIAIGLDERGRTTEHDAPAALSRDNEHSGAASSVATSSDGADNNQVFDATATQKARRRTGFPVHSRGLLYRLWITNAINGAGIGMFGPFVTYWFFTRFGAGAGEIGALFAVVNASAMVSTLSAAGSAKRWGLVRAIVVVRTVQAVLLVPMALAPNFAIAGAIYLVRMVAQRMGMPLRQSYAIGLAHRDERAAVAAFSDVPSQLAMAASPLLTGYLFDEVSLALPFEIAGALQLVSSTLFWGFFRHIPPEEEREGAPHGAALRASD